MPNKNRPYEIGFVVIAIVVAFIYRGQLKNVWIQSFNRYFPCQAPIYYTIDKFDTRFKISKADFTLALKEAEKIWEDPIDKNLFENSDGGNLKINLVFDERQETTNKLNNVEESVQSTRASYNTLKTKYVSLVSSYNSDKSAFDSRLAAFNVRKKAYDDEVSSLNKRGGGSKETVARLNAEKSYLNSEITNLNNLQTALNAKASEINSLVNTLNKLANTLNIQVDNFNTIGSNLGTEFNEGVFKADASGEEIDIYQFDNRARLVRVIAHELGHALGLDHVEDPKAIMYRLNVGENEKLSNTDLTELKALCRIK